MYICDTAYVDLGALPIETFSHAFTTQPDSYSCILSHSDGPLKTRPTLDHTPLEWTYTVEWSATLPLTVEQVWSSTMSTPVCLHWLSGAISVLWPGMLNSAK